jgi:hypothetical protein
MNWVMRFVSISKPSSHRDGAHHGGFRVPYTLSLLFLVGSQTEKLNENSPKMNSSFTLIYT